MIRYENFKTKVFRTRPPMYALKEKAEKDTKYSQIFKKWLEAAQRNLSMYMPEKMIKLLCIILIPIKHM